MAERRNRRIEATWDEEILVATIRIDGVEQIWRPISESHDGFQWVRESSGPHGSLCITTGSAWQLIHEVCKLDEQENG